jgi:hypothetical protein
MGCVDLEGFDQSISHVTIRFFKLGWLQYYMERSLLVGTMGLGFG